MKILYYILIPLLISYGVSVYSQHRGITDEYCHNTSVSPYFHALQHDYDVKFYFIDLEISNNTTYLKGNTLIKLESRTGFIDTIAFELNSLYTVDSVVVNSVNILKPVFGNNLLKIPLPADLKSQKLLTAVVYYAGDARMGGYFSGVRREKDYTYDKWVTFTLSEPFQSMNWFPCKQDLTDKADSAWIFLTVDKGLKAGSNGLLAAINSLGPDKKRYEWKTRYPISYYLLSFSVSEYIDYTFYVDLPGKDSMPVQNYLYDHPSLLLNEKERIDKTGDILLLYSELLGIYPFYLEKYGHCHAPMGGGMEHQTMTTITHFDFRLVAHELAHQWYGNYVTCKTWQDIWINEGFASYLEYVAVEMLGTDEEAELWMEYAQNRAMVFPEGSVFLNPEEVYDINRIFNPELSYKKGAVILHMLRYELDDDVLFFRILKEFLAEFAFGTATGADFRDFVNTVTGEDYAWFFDQWYYGNGYPYFYTSWHQTKDSLFLSAIQESSSIHTTFFRTHLDYKIVYIDGSEETVRVEYLKNHEHFSFHSEKPVERIIPDPEKKVLKFIEVFKQYNTNQLFEVTPNPFIDNILIKFLINIRQKRIMISSLNGSVVFEATTSADVLNPELSFLTPGFYILNVSDGENDYSVKILKSAGKDK